MKLACSGAIQMDGMPSAVAARFKSLRNGSSGVVRSAM